jgi:hypothetical protein
MVWVIDHVDEICILNFQNPKLENPKLSRPIEESLQKCKMQNRILHFAFCKYKSQLIICHCDWTSQHMIPKYKFKLR